MVKRDIYTLWRLEEIYVELLKKGASIHMVKDLKKLDKGIILRHDLDSEMESALTVAQMEHKLGIRSSYFFLLTSRFYNVYCTHCRQILREILDLGHEIGLHFDASIYPEERLEEALKEEKRILEIIIQQEVHSMSLHNPSNTGKYPYFDNIVNCYDWSIFSPRNYFSDSGFGFKATVDQIINEAKHNVVQVVFHPTIYCIRNEDAPPGVIHITKTEIERFANALVGPIVVHPLFVEEIQRYPEAHLNISVKLKD